MPEYTMPEDLSKFSDKEFVEHATSVALQGGGYFEAWQTERVAVVLSEALRRLEKEAQSMNTEERRAFEWAINQEHQSVAARYARTLARYIKSILGNPPTE